MDDKAAQDLRRWAIEAAVALHGKNGSTTDVVLVEAKKLLDFVSSKAPGQG